MTTSTKFNKVAAQIISWVIIIATVSCLYMAFQGVAVHASIR